MNTAASPALEPADSLRRRPAWLLAMGHASPPPNLHIAGRPFRQIELFKHDAFAATALYHAEPTEALPEKLPEASGGTSGGVSGGVVLKFSRTQSAFGLPFAWLGRHLSGKEQRFFKTLRDVQGVPNDVGTVTLDGAAIPNVAGHVYIPGKPLHRDDRPADGFFATLSALLDEVHKQGVAVIDLNKTENIIVDPQGRPHLLDFQISVMRRAAWAWLPGSAAWLRTLQRADRYYLAKHWSRMRPDEFAHTGIDLDALRPVTTKIWRTLWRPVILLRRRLFVILGIRRGAGTADTELPTQPTASP